MKCTSTVKLNMGTIARLDSAAVTALEQTAEAVHTDLVQSQVMPRRSGHLQNESTFVETSMSGQGSVAIVSSTPYARRLYFHPEYNFSTEANPNAKGEWFEDWLPGGRKQDFANNTFAQIYRRLAGT